MTWWQWGLIGWGAILVLFVWLMWATRRLDEEGD